MRQQPILFEWRTVDANDPKTGEVRLVRAMVPNERYRRAAERQFGDEGSEHCLAPFEERNMAMHKATFAELNDLYNNLPETVWYRTDSDGRFILGDLGDKEVRFPTVDHFRYWLLIEEGFCTEWVNEAKNEREARKTAKQLRVRLTHARIRVDGDKVIVREAESMRIGEMGAARFKDAMDAILARARSYVGVTASVSRKNAGRAA